MPRPPLRNRRRQNSFKLRTPQPRKQARVPPIPDPAQVRQYLEAQVAGKPAGKKLGDSDDSDQLVTTRSSGRNRKRLEVYASGGVGNGDKPGSYPSRAQRTRNMREDTQEILNQRSKSGSRSVSRANSEQSTENAPGRKTLPMGQENTTSSRIGSQAVKIGTSEMRAKPRALEEANVQQSHPIEGAASVIGKIKARKRQDSILKIIQADGNDDSTMMSRGEAEFLPDAASTPAASNRNPTPQRSSLKRKRGIELSESIPNAPSTSMLNSTAQGRSSVLRSSPEIPHPSRSQRRKLTTSSVTHQEEDSIMALPESSDSEGMVDKEISSAWPNLANNKKNRPLAPRTEALQNLMPSRKRELPRRQQPKDDFDLPEDSTSNSDITIDEDEEEPSAFLPERRRRTQKPSSSQPKTMQSSKKSTNRSRARTKAKENAKSTNTKSLATPSPLRVRTPLPLSSVKASARSIQAKSPSRQGTTILQDKTSKVVNTPVVERVMEAKSKTGKKQYGGYRLRRTGKENQPTASSGEGSDEDGNGNNDDLQGPVKPPEGEAKLHEHLEGPEIKAWKKRWANIDDFQMEIEEISISTRSSSPMAR